MSGTGFDVSPFFIADEGTELNAFFMSMEAAIATPPWRSVSRIPAHTWSSNGPSGSRTDSERGRFFLPLILSVRLSGTRSRARTILSRRQIGRYTLGVVGSLPGLSSKTKLASFHGVGNVASWKHAV